MRSAVLVLAFLAAPLAAAHGEEHGLDEQLVANGEKLLVGSFTAPQPGALVVVPFTPGPLSCGAAAGGYRIPLSPTAGLMIAANETEVAILFDLPAEDDGYVGFGIDTGDATRALVLMEENAIVLHALLQIGKNERDGPRVFRTGALGVRYALPGSHGHGLNTSLEGDVFLDTDDSFAGGRWCRTDDAHRTIVVNRSDLAESLAAGTVVHVVAIHDAQVPYFRSRLVEGAPTVLHLNLYLARAGEDPARLREAFDPSVRPYDVVALLALGLGLVLVTRP